MFSVLFLLSSTAEARPTKADCKAHAGSIRDLSQEIGLSPEITGRALLDTVKQWIEAQDAATIQQVIGRIEEATAGVQQCEAGGHTNVVLAIKGTSKKLETAVLPWLRNASTADSCQSLISQAVRKKTRDLDGAIEDLERSIGKCEEDSWLPEAHRNLAAAHYERGDLEQNDFESAYEQTRRALEVSRGYEEGNRKALSANLAKYAIEAGRDLMERAAYETARSHWAAYIDIFGSSSFDVLFQVEEVAQGSRMLRDLVDARYQLALACLELADSACVSNAMLPAAADYGDNAQPIRDLTERTFEHAADSTCADTEALYVLAFDLLTAWQELDPSAYQLKKFLNESLLARDREERLGLLRLTDKCWIPMQVAEALRQEGEDYIEEVKIAAACGESGAEAQQILARFYLQAANDRLDRLPATARTVSEKRAALDEIERQLLPEIQDPAGADELRSRLAQERAKLRQSVARDEQDKLGRYSGCTELLATIQWNRRRERDYFDEERQFKDGCCRFLVANAGGWESWMRSKPENERLSDEEIGNKKKLMQRYCQP
jgi:hypothetical protein